VRQRTDQIDAFTTETSCLTIVWAVMQAIRAAYDPSRLIAEVRWLRTNNQPAAKAGSGGGVFCCASSSSTGSASLFVGIGELLEGRRHVCAHVSLEPGTLQGALLQHRCAQTWCSLRWRSLL